MKPEDVLAIAQQGNPKVIAAIINRTTEAHGIFVRVARRGSCLYVLLEGDVTDQQEGLVSFMQTSLQKLQLQPIDSAIIYGRQKGQSAMVWSEHIKISPAIEHSGPDSNAIAPFLPNPKRPTALSKPSPSRFTPDPAAPPLSADPSVVPNPSPLTFDPRLDERVGGGGTSLLEAQLEEEAIAEVNAINMVSDGAQLSLDQDSRDSEDPPQNPIKATIQRQRTSDTKSYNPISSAEENIEDSDQPEDVIPSDEGQAETLSPSLLSSNRDEFAQEDLQVGNNQQSRSTLGMSTLDNRETQLESVGAAEAPGQSSVMDYASGSITAKFNTLVKQAEVKRLEATADADSNQEHSQFIVEPESVSVVTRHPESEEHTLDAHPDSDSPLAAKSESAAPQSLELAGPSPISPELAGEPLRIPTAMPVSLKPSSDPEEYIPTVQQDSEGNTREALETLEEQPDTERDTSEVLNTRDEIPESVEGEIGDVVNEALEDAVDGETSEVPDTLDQSPEETDSEASDVPDTLDETQGSVNGEVRDMPDTRDETPENVDGETNDAGEGQQDNSCAPGSSREEQQPENPDLNRGPDLDNIDLDAFIRYPEALVLLVFTIAFFIWQTYRAILDDAAPEGMLTASKLAKRLGVNPSTISRRKRKEGFEEWAQSIDPDGLAWSYHDGFFIPHMGEYS